MANRQRGRAPSGDRSPAGNRSPAGSRGAFSGRAARTVPVSRSPGRSWEAVPSGTPVCSEPEVRRWPHPLEDPPPPAPEPAMHYIRCALSYQNQLLADIKALLETLAAALPAAEKAPEQEKGGENLSKL